MNTISYFDTHHWVTHNAKLKVSSTPHYILYVDNNNNKKHCRIIKATCLSSLSTSCQQKSHLLIINLFQNISLRAFPNPVSPWPYFNMVHSCFQFEHKTNVSKTTTCVKIKFTQLWSLCAGLKDALSSTVTISLQNKHLDKKQPRWIHAQHNVLKTKEWYGTFSRGLTPSSLGVSLKDYLANILRSNAWTINKATNLKTSVTSQLAQISSVLQ